MTTAIPEGPHRPTADSVTAQWWAAVQNRELLVNVCGSCGRTTLYVRPFCPLCWNDDVALKSASGRARLYTWSVVHQNAAPFNARVPYILAMVDLEEGPRLMTVVEQCPVDQLRADMPLIVDFRTDDDGFVVPIFRPE